MIKAIIFDLDNTLYDQKLYNFGAFKDVSAYISKKYGMNKKIIYNSLVNAWKKNPSAPDLFNKVLPKIGINEFDVKTLVKIFHLHKPRIKPYANTKSVLLKLKKNYKLGLLTDGRPATQKKKIFALNIEKFFDEIVFTSARSRIYAKPNMMSYKLIIKKLKLSPNEIVYVADNPYVDFIPAKKLGIKTIRILKGVFKEVKVKKEFDADYKIKKLDEIFSILNQLG